MKAIRGVYTVEFAIVASLLFVLLFACLEFGRTTYTFAALNEGTRRAARLAAVCPLNDPAIYSGVDFLGISGFNATSASSGGNVSVNYLDSTGAVLAAPTLSAVSYVRVSVANYSVSLSIPGINPTITSPAFTVTLPAESLGLSVNGAGAAVSTAC